MRALNLPRFIVFGALAIVFAAFFQGCSKDGDLNVFSVQDDIDLGRQLSQEIAANPAQYPLLNETEHRQAYGHIQRITNSLLNTGELNHRDDFAWEVKLVNDTVLNAFCAPGGYIYVYTGLIKFLDNESELAGVMGHEIAHADLRHSTERLTKAYGLETLLSIVLGNDQSTIKTMAANLALLAYSRSDETESDEASVRYLCQTDYDRRGTAGFFQKLIDMGATGNTPQFLSTHPNPENRVENINETADGLGCSTQEGTYETRYQEFKSVLP